MPQLITAHRIVTVTVSIDCDFVKPLSIGDMLPFALRVTTIGNARRRSA
ncbi:MAG: hypothetical protein JSW48_12385 [Betaproteobacteria bacterium]|nr:MAG: hypothetical protein JSW48_12385 [Betaproteobacteria bacterium]